MDRGQATLAASPVAVAAALVLLGLAIPATSEAVAACERAAGEASGRTSPRFVDPQVDASDDVVKLYGATRDGGDLWCIVDIRRRRLVSVTYRVSLMTFKDASGEELATVDQDVQGAVSDVMRCVDVACVGADNGRL